MELIKTMNKGEFTIEIFKKFEKCDMGRPSYRVICKDIKTGEINEEMSDIVYLSMNAVNEFIGSIEEVKQVESEQQKQIKTITKTNKIKDDIPQIEMLATYGQINFKGNIVEVVFTNETESNKAIFKYRRSWSNKKYLDTAISKSGVKISWDFRYGWDLEAI